MADLLIRHLKSSAESHSSLNLLVSQWDFDEKLIPKALQSISSLFPHYSRHDDSHSKQILINIERILGEEGIHNLSSTDTWLILEAAYWHDIGMVVPSSEMEKALADDDFNQMVSEIRSNPAHDLYNFCRVFSKESGISPIGYSGSPLDGVEQFRFLMAEWFRRKHADRAQPIVEDPWGSIGISSPRTELIPKRIYRLLGMICRMHGASFNSLFSPAGLPYREAGLAQEDCHPRYVACLLRLGDLLDLDDNRFCPVMMKIAGENRPSLSKAHERKHAAITHLRIDRERIEVSSECEDVESYVESYNWFRWLKEEVQNQMAHWRDIAPNRNMGLLPMLGPVKLSLNGNMQYIDEGALPRFTVNPEKASEILKGVNLYESKFSCIREILQNAVDASLMAAWLETTNKDIFYDGPTTNSVFDVFHNYPVEVEIVDKGDAGEGLKKWRLSIRDYGIGISKEDLRYMLDSGSSSKNKRRNDIKNSIPEWMKPSGVFGIGFQSVFMISDKVRCCTKSRISGEYLEVDFYSPSSDKQGVVNIYSGEGSVFSYGTLIEIDLELDKVPSRWHYYFDNKETLAKFVLSEMDPIFSEDIPYEAAMILDSVNEFSYGSLIPINMNFKNKSIGDFQRSDGGKPKISKYVSVDGFCALAELSFTSSVHEICTFSYRGQRFNVKSSSFFPFCRLHIDVLSGSAGSWLSYNRDEVLKASKLKLESCAREVIRDLILKELSESNYSDEEIKYVSIFSEYMFRFYPDGRWECLKDNPDVSRKWMLLDFLKNGSVQEFLESSQTTLGVEANSNTHSSSAEYVIHRHFEHGSVLRNMLIDAWLLKHEGIVSLNIDDDGLEYANLGTTDDYCASDAYWVHKIINACNISGRVLIPVLEGFEMLVLKKGISIRARYLFDLSEQGQEFILLPYFFVSGDLLVKNRNGAVRFDFQSLERKSRFINWIRDKLKSSLVDDDIEKEYLRLSNYLEDRIKKQGTWDKWKELKDSDHSDRL